jgi:hypothetical protein
VERVAAAVALRAQLAEEAEPLGDDVVRAGSRVTMCRAARTPSSGGR